MNMTALRTSLSPHVKQNIPSQGESEKQMQLVGEMGYKTETFALHTGTVGYSTCIQSSYSIHIPFPV